MIAVSRAICRNSNVTESETSMTAYLISLALAGLIAIALCEVYK
jgi:hypothetical protein